MASMRPQHITAENAVERAAAALVQAASMRPQHITAENAAGCVIPDTMQIASMRPQHITAENVGQRDGIGRPRAGFNEAAAYHCGKLGRALTVGSQGRSLQ